MTEIVRCQNLLSVDYYIIRTGLMMWCVNRTSNFLPMLVTTSDVKSSRPKSRPKWPRGQVLASASASKLWPSASAWPRSRCLIIIIGHFSGKNRVKFGNFV